MSNKVYDRNFKELKSVNLRSLSYCLSLYINTQFLIKTFGDGAEVPLACGQTLFLITLFLIDVKKILKQICLFNVYVDRRRI